MHKFFFTCRFIETLLSLVTFIILFNSKYSNVFANLPNAVRTISIIQNLNFKLMTRYWYLNLIGIP